MSTKSKRRAVRRTRRDETSLRATAQVRSAERRAIGEIMGALLSAITFGALEPAAPPQQEAHG